MNKILNLTRKNRSYSISGRTDWYFDNQIFICEKLDTILDIPESVNQITLTAKPANLSIGKVPPHSAIVNINERGEVNFGGAYESLLWTNLISFIRRYFTYEKNLSVRGVELYDSETLLITATFNELAPISTQTVVNKQLRDAKGRFKSANVS